MKNSRFLVRCVGTHFCWNSYLQHLLFPFSPVFSLWSLVPGFRVPVCCVWCFVSCFRFRILSILCPVHVLSCPVSCFELKVSCVWSQVSSPKLFLLLSGLRSQVSCVYSQVSCQECGVSSLKSQVARVWSQVFSFALKHMSPHNPAVLYVTFVDRVQSDSCVFSSKPSFFSFQSSSLPFDECSASDFHRL